MSADVVQANYDALDALTQKFGRQAELSEEMYGRVQQAVHALEQGGWEGQGASAFFAEMDGDIYPALQRLINALEEAQSVTREIKQIIQQAEEEAAAPFGGQAAEGSSPVTAPGIVSGPGVVSGTPVDPNNPLVTRNPHSLFTDKYMDSLVGSKIRGEDSQRLNNTMKELAKNPTDADLDRVINEIAAARGVPADKLRADYQKFLQIREQARAIARQKGIDPPEDVNDFFHGDFMASTAQLRYGQVVGDAFGIDPVFGAMLNPTGGMVGPGNLAVNPGDDDALGYHGIVHDAAGYLYNYHDLGPGYNYLGQENHRDPGNPLTGQQSGVRYWNEKLNPGIVTDITHGVGDFVIDNTERVIDTVGSSIDAVQNFGAEAAKQVEDFLEFVF
ncbi:MAG: WXG100 family type VII secretion target [Ardenticatenaceae bacterium]|nr:WXG100 family type VII secretion target [Ardenticatenaceae bacterium]